MNQALKPSDPLNELILVVKREHLFPEPAWQGFKNESLDSYIQLIMEHKEFHPRARMEEDPTYKQIIPYLIFRHTNRYFLMQRQSHASEQRLKNKFSLGIGGHINQHDIQDDSLFSWAQREFHEEVLYQGSLTVTPLGIVNDDSNSVGKVHLGLVLLLEGNEPTISIQSELKSGTLATIDECRTHLNAMESWSQMVYSHLIMKS